LKHKIMLPSLLIKPMDSTDTFEVLKRYIFATFTIKNPRFNRHIWSIETFDKLIIFNWYFIQPTHLKYWNLIKCCNTDYAFIQPTHLKYWNFLLWLLLRFF